MFSNADEVLRYLKDEDVEFVDVRFIDLPGVMQHFNVPAESFDTDAFEDGLMFDGSSIRGFQAINESDMKLIPDVATAFLDPFRDAKTLVMNFSIRDPFTNEPYSRDPRSVAANAEAYLKSTGIADTVYFGPEAEFYVFDDVRFETRQNAGYYFIDSIEGAWNTGRVEEGGNLGYKTPYKGGYFPVPPVDHFADIRDDMVRTLMEVGLKVERSHHEVGTAGQGEINYRFNTLTRAADELMLFKYVIKNVAWAHGKSETFMHKPIFGDNGLHQPDGELLPPPGAGLRGSGQPGLLRAQPLGLHPHPGDGHLAQGQAHRVPRAGSLGQPVPVDGRAAHGRPRRHQEQDRAARPGRQGSLRAPAGRDGHDPAGAGLPSGRARGSGEGQRVPAGRQRVPGRPHRDLDRLQASQRG